MDTLPPPKPAISRPPPTAAPCIVGDVVYQQEYPQASSENSDVHTFTAYLAAYAFADNQLLWRIPVEKVSMQAPCSLSQTWPIWFVKISHIPDSNILEITSCTGMRYMIDLVTQGILKTEAIGMTPRQQANKVAQHEQLNIPHEFSRLPTTAEWDGIHYRQGTQADGFPLAPFTSYLVAVSMQNGAILWHIPVAVKPSGENEKEWTEFKLSFSEMRIREMGSNLMIVDAAGRQYHVDLQQRKVKKEASVLDLFDVKEMPPPPIR